MTSIASNTRLTHRADVMHSSFASNSGSVNSNWQLTAIPSNWRLSATGQGGVVWSPESAGASGHALLSLVHTDTTPASVSRGDMVAASSNATWKRMPTPAADAYTSDRFLGTINSDPHWRTRYYGVDALTSSSSNAFTGQVDIRGDGIAISVSSNTMTLVNLGGAQGPPGTGGLTHSYLGKNAIGASTETLTANRWYFKKVTPTKDGFITGVGVYLKGVTESATPSLDFQVWADASGSPREVLGFNGTSRTAILVLDAINGAGGLNARWLTLSMWVPVSGGTDYWIGFGSGAANFQLYKDTGSGADKFGPIATGVIGDFGFGGAATSTTDDYSIRASFLS